MRWLRRLVGVAVVVAILVIGWWFAAANQQAVQVDYVWGTEDRPLWQVIVACFGLGFLLAGGIGTWFGLRGKLVQHRYRKAVGRLEAEVHQLRNLPLAPDGDGAGASAAERDALPAGERGA